MFKIKCYKDILDLEANNTVPARIVTMLKEELVRVKEWCDEFDDMHRDENYDHICDNCGIRTAYDCIDSNYGLNQNNLIYAFNYKGLFVRIWGLETVLTDEFFRSFTM